MEYNHTFITDHRLEENHEFDIAILDEENIAILDEEFQYKNRLVSEVLNIRRHMASTCKQT